MSQPPVVRTDSWIWTQQQHGARSKTSEALLSVCYPRCSASTTDKRTPCAHPSASHRPPWCSLEKQAPARGPGNPLMFRRQGPSHWSRPPVPMASRVPPQQNLCPGPRSAVHGRLPLPAPHATNWQRTLSFCLCVCVRVCVFLTVLPLMVEPATSYAPYALQSPPC